MISQDDIDAMAHHNRSHNPACQEIQFQMRQCFELGYRAGNIGVTQPNEWREDWLKSAPRKWLVDNGLISGMDAWR